jgi:serine/threonine protein kinase
MARIEQVRDDRQAVATQTVAPPAPALQQLGDFRILREIGRGGMGIVYEAEQVSLGRHVALKVLPAGALEDQRLRLRFQREARAAARLHHTNIVPVFCVGEEGGEHYYVMQYIQGLGLDAVLAELRQRLFTPHPGQTIDVRMPKLYHNTLLSHDRKFWGRHFANDVRMKLAWSEETIKMGHRS